ncbi:MAG: hypothetical protein L0332_09595 [Chloroflexi bacterium]|nr:hypothetical protein [Chloroflexota bacterium]MCI0581003.1 hypothetical protein [Chloroflexota bacterium]MCI0646342.1 hypothetical protein [Chloroflexota bacterium]MCI0726960.1 hypothetical protein [Chloroflexota bacterium]
MSRRVLSLGVAFVLMVGMMSAAPPAAGQGQDQPQKTTTTTGSQPVEQDGGEEESALPAGLSAILATLGLYVVIMFTMAIGTEITVDVAKLAIGLKTKPTARQAMEQFKDLVPGTLENLGASLEAEQQLQRHITALSNLLKPVAEAEDFIFQLQEGHIGQAVKTILQKVKAEPLPTQEELVQLVSKELGEAISRLAAELSLGDYITVPLQDKINQLLVQLSQADAQELLRRTVLLLQGQTADIVVTWARNQLGILSAGSRSVVEKNYFQVLRPQLSGLGLPETELQAVDDWFKTFLTKFESLSSQQVDIYLASLNELLKGVERQRYMIQSPARKVWRKLSTWPGIGQVLSGIERAWNRLMRRGDDDRTLRISPHIDDVTETARVMLELEQRHQDEAASRVRWLRTLSVIVGIVLAYMLQIDSANLLDPLLPDGAANFLTAILVPQGTYSLLLFNVTLANNITAGIILTGLAASAGSSFWHDQLTRLQAVKSVSEAAFGTIQNITVKAQQEK